ncbi:MAG: site-specific integrase [Lentisphaeria bacterium]|nr:MAG: site-specific integrase [Lentisphaeria bacterium]
MGIEYKNGTYYYRFMIRGKMLRGTCTNCRTRRQAEAYEQRIKKEHVEERVQVDQVRYLEKRLVEVQGGSIIPLSRAIDMALEKPPLSNSTPKVLAQHRHFFHDFVAYMSDTYQITTLQQVRKKHAEAYMEYVRTNGRYQHTVSYNRGGKTITYSSRVKHLSSMTQNKIHMTCKLVFSKLQEDGGLTKNPFDFSRMQLDKENREIFDSEEIQAILSGSNDFVVPIMRIALYTGLRLGDVVSLKWENIDFKNGFITKKMEKTDKTVVVPVLDYDYMQSLYTARQSDEYVLPQQMEMYTDNQSGISYRVKKVSQIVGNTNHTANGTRQESIHQGCSLLPPYLCNHLCRERNPLVRRSKCLGAQFANCYRNLYRSFEKEDTCRGIQKFKLSDQKMTRHGLPNIFKMCMCLLKLKDLPRRSIQKVAYIISENLSKEDMETVF